MPFILSFVSLDEIPSMVQKFKLLKQIFKNKSTYNFVLKAFAQFFSMCYALLLKPYFEFFCNKNLYIYMNFSILVKLYNTHQKYLYDDKNII